MMLKTIATPTQMRVAKSMVSTTREIQAKDRCEGKEVPSGTEPQNVPLPLCFFPRKHECHVHEEEYQTNLLIWDYHAHFISILYHELSSKDKMERWSRGSFFSVAIGHCALLPHKSHEKLDIVLWNAPYIEIPERN